MSELTAEQVRTAIFNGSSYASYDGVKYYADGIDMQAIADELNTRAQTVFGMTLDEVRQMMKRDAERERTCKNTDDEFPYFQCSECGCYAVVGYGNSGDGLPNYCPSCGAKVVGE